METIFHDNTGIRPVSLQQQIQEIILKKFRQNEYQEFIERIDTKDVLYRIKFEVPPDSIFFIIHVMDYEEFKKNR